MQPRRFILTAIDPDYGNPSFETLFIVERPDELRTLLDLSADQDPGLEMSYRLDPQYVTAITRYFGIELPSPEHEAFLYPWTGPDEIPYLVHTGYELALMVDGRKQLTRMFEVYPPERHPGEDRFDRCVAAGLLHKEVDLELFSEPWRMKDGRVLMGMRTVYYTRLGEEWRINACRLIHKASAKSGWNVHYERLEGMLFGYEEWQNDWWIENLRQRNAVHGTMLVWIAVDQQALSGIEFAGYRALPRPNGNVKLVCSFDERPEDRQPRSLMDEADAVALVRLRVKARGFVELIGTAQKVHYELLPERVAGLNRLIVGEIEVVVRPGSSLA